MWSVETHDGTVHITIDDNDPLSEQVSVYRENGQIFILIWSNKIGAYEQIKLPDGDLGDVNPNMHTLREEN